MSAIVVGEKENVLRNRFNQRRSNENTHVTLTVGGAVPDVTAGTVVSCIEKRRVNVTAE